MYVLKTIQLFHIFRAGRPRREVDIEDIEFLRGLRFSWTKISRILSISRSTLYRRLEEHHLSRELYFSELSVDRIIKRIKIEGHLVSRGIFVQLVFTESTQSILLLGGVLQFDAESTLQRDQMQYGT